jgi:flagellin-specific chaperone FliS
MKMAMDATRIFLRQAETAIAIEDQPAKAKALGSAARLVEFLLGLSGCEPGPLSTSLAEVYQYILAAVVKANAWDDAQAVVAGRIAVEQLATVWRNAFPDGVDPNDGAKDQAPAIAEGVPCLTRSKWLAPPTR